MMLLSVQSQEAMRYVASFDQLHRATLDGVRVIVLTDHLKLASAETIGGPGPILTLPESTDAILVRFVSAVGLSCAIFVPVAQN